MCGASGAESIGFYGGVDVERQVGWWDSTRSKYGFAAVTITRESMIVKYIDASSMDVVHAVAIPHPDMEKVRDKEKVGEERAGSQEKLGQEDKEKEGNQAQDKEKGNEEANACETGEDEGAKRGEGAWGG